MKKRIVLSVLIAGMLVSGIEGLCLAGVEPSPFQPEINKLHSIELNVAAINKRLAKVNEFEILPEGTTNYLNAMANQMQGLKVRMEEVLSALTIIPSETNPYIGQDEVVFALDSIRVDTKGSFTIIEDIASRMGVEPSPFLPVFRDISITIIERINIHILPILPPLQPPLLPPPQLP
jgi:hypothetical protein